MFCHEMETKPVDWMCSEVVLVLRESNIKRPYNTKHAYTFGKLKASCKTTRCTHKK
jgi:hypothetical protein